MLPAGLLMLLPLAWCAGRCMDSTCALLMVQNGTGCSFYRAYRHRAGFEGCERRCAWPCCSDASGHFAP